LAQRTIKDRLKCGVKSALTGPDSSATPDKVTRILTYHSIGDRDDDMNVEVADFREQMAWLRSAAVPVIALEDAAAGKAGVAITFDDGYRDNLANAAPILCEHEFPATVFMVAGRAGDFLGTRRDEASRLMNWGEVRALHGLGITIGAHTMTHRRLSAMTETEQREEIAGSVAVIGDAIGESVTQFSYPYGSARDYTHASIEAVKECGCRLAVSNRYGYNDSGSDPYQLRRVWIDRSDTGAMFQAKVMGRLDRLAVFDSRVGLWARGAMNRVLGRSG